MIDEFATLAAELPDFLGALVGVAQRGRSLGRPPRARDAAPGGCRQRRHPGQHEPADRPAPAGRRRRPRRRRRRRAGVVPAGRAGSGDAAPRRRRARRVPGRAQLGAGRARARRPAARRRRAGPATAAASPSSPCSCARSATPPRCPTSAGPTGRGCRRCRRRSRPPTSPRARRRRRRRARRRPRQPVPPRRCAGRPATATWRSSAPSVRARRRRCGSVLTAAVARRQPADVPRLRRRRAWRRAPRRAGRGAPTAAASSGSTSASACPGCCAGWRPSSTAAGPSRRRPSRPDIVLAVDGMPALRTALDDPLDHGDLDLLGRVVADGPAVGIVTVLTAERPAALPAAVPGDVRDALDRAPRRPGRGDGVRVAPAARARRRARAVRRRRLRPAGPGRPRPRRRHRGGRAGRPAAARRAAGDRDRRARSARWPAATPSSSSASTSRRSARPCSRCPTASTCSSPGRRAAGARRRSPRSPRRGASLHPGGLVRVVASSRTRSVAPTTTSPTSTPRWRRSPAASTAGRRCSSSTTPTGSTTRASARWPPSTRRGLLIAAAGRPDALRPLYGHWTTVVRRSRLGRAPRRVRRHRRRPARRAPAAAAADPGPSRARLARRRGRTPAGPARVVTAPFRRRGATSAGVVGLVVAPERLAPADPLAALQHRAGVDPCRQPGDEHRRRDRAEHLREPHRGRVIGRDHEKAPRIRLRCLCIAALHRQRCRRLQQIAIVRLNLESSFQHLARLRRPAPRIERQGVGKRKLC